MDLESVTIRTSRPGHPLLVKIGYHPRWKAEGADGPYLVSPGLMMIVPRQPEVRLFYARTTADVLGAALSVAMGAGIGVLAFRRRRAETTAAAAPASPPPTVDACDLPKAPRRWGGLVPGTLLVLLAAGRLVGGVADHASDVANLYERASKAYGAERWDEAAEFARHALAWPSAPELTAELRCLRGESLLRAGRPGEAATEFEGVTQGAHLPEALFGLTQAHGAAGAAAAAARDRLLNEFADTPWAERVRAEAAPASDAEVKPPRPTPRASRRPGPR